MFIYKNFAQLAATLQMLDGFDLTQVKNFFVHKGELDRAKKNLKVMKNVIQILDSLYTDVTAEVAALTARIMPASLHHGLESIPDEVLAHVLAMDTHDSDSGVRPEELRLVNRRFRDVVSSTPECWSKVLFETKRRNIFPDRPVDLYVDNCKWGIKKIFNNYQRRIRQLDIHLDPSRWPDNYFIEDKYLENLDLSSIKSLIVRGRGVLSLAYFSQLTNLSCLYIPRPCGLRLTHCELDLPIEYFPEYDYHDFYACVCCNDVEHFSGYKLKCGPDYTELIHFLASMPSLQSLSFPYDTSGLQHIPNNTIVALPKLKYLHIRCNCLCDTLLEVLECPNLETMDVLLDKFHNGQDDKGIESNPNFIFPSVTSLTIRGATDRGPEKNKQDADDYTPEPQPLQVNFSDIHHIFPHLRTLTIYGDFRVYTTKRKSGTQDQNSGLSLDHLESVYIRIPLPLVYRLGIWYDPSTEQILEMCWNNWNDLSAIFRWYKNNGARLKHVEVRNNLEVENWQWVGGTTLYSRSPRVTFGLEGRGHQLGIGSTLSIGEDFRRQYIVHCETMMKLMKSLINGQEERLSISSSVL